MYEVATYLVIYLSFLQEYFCCFSKLGRVTVTVGNTLIIDKEKPELTLLILLSLSNLFDSK